MFSRFRSRRFPIALFPIALFPIALWSITLWSVMLPTSAAHGQETPPAAAAADLQFNFDGTPWRDVIQWLAEDGQLALHVRDLPTGSFTYSDPRKYTNDEAISRVNLFLIGQGYALIKSNQLLSVINLDDPKSLQQLDSLAPLVTTDELDKAKSHDVVKCIFSLKEVKVEDAVEELSALKLMTEPAVFKRTNRMMLTDTVGKLRSVKKILDAFEPEQLEGGLVMKNFALKNVDAEDILAVARPHLGLATGESIGIDVSVSSDLRGKNIFVTGVEDKVKMIEGLVEELDKSEQDLAAAGGAELKSHAVTGGNVETVYNVLVTLLAQESVRLSMDKKANAVVALASPEIQKEIAATVAQLQAAEPEFEVIPLKTVDPYFAITLIEQMLDLPGPYDLDEDKDDDDEAVQHPKIDADPGNMRLFVRGKPSQIEQIKKIVKGLDGDAAVGAAGAANEQIRVLPLQGAEANRVIRAAASFWRQDNPVILYPNGRDSAPKNERVVSPDAKAPQQPAPVKPAATSTSDTSKLFPGAVAAPAEPSATRPPTDAPRVLAGNVRSQAAIIRCQITARGLMVQCDDPKALNQFCRHVENIAGPSDSLAVNPIVFYLKYAKPDDAVRMLGEMIDGAESAKVGEAGTLVNGYVSGSSTFLGSLLTTRAGTTTLTAGSMTVVAESRLNRLIVQGTAADVAMAEAYLKIIDKQKSITDVETYGRTQVIELKFAKAVEVAAAIREAFAGRVTQPTATNRPQGQPGQPNQPQGRGPQQPQPQPPSRSQNNNNNNNNNKGKNDNKKGGNAAQQQARDLEPKMVVAVHEASNSLIITAPPQLFEQAEALARHLDTRNEIVVEIFPTDTPGVAEALQGVLGDPTDSNAASKSRTTSNAPRPTPSTATPNVNKPPVPRDPRR